jgi:hypothetical protein
MKKEWRRLPRTFKMTILLPRTLSSPRAPALQKGTNTIITITITTMLAERNMGRQMKRGKPRKKRRK